MALGVGGTVVARARAIIETDTRGLDKGLDRSERRFKKWNSIATKAALGVGVAAAVGAKQAIDAASDLSEEMNKTRVVFGKNGADMLKWSENSAKAFGASRRAALQYAGGFGAMFRSIGGIGDKEMARMSKGLVELGGDLASFYNADTAESLEAMKSALSGQIEPMRRFGVFLTQDRIKAEALAMGLVKATVDMDKVKVAQEQIAIAGMKVTEAQKKHGKESVQARSASLALQKAEFGLKKLLDGKVGTVSAAAKAQATYAIIQRDTAVAHKDFERTADGAANKQRILAAQIEDTKAKLGMGLLPVYEKALGITSDLVTWGQKHTGTVKLLGGAVVALAGFVLAANAAWKVYTAGARAAELVSKLLNSTLGKNPYVRVALLILAIGTALVVAYKKSETFRRIVKSVMETTRDVVASIVGKIVWYFDKWLGGFAAIAEAASHLPFVGDKFKGVADKINGAREKMRDLDDAIRGAPDEKKIDVKVDLSFNSRYGAGSPASSRAGDGFVAAVSAGAQGYANDHRSSLFRSAFPSAANPGGLSPWVLDELGMAQSFGLGLTSGFRPGSTTSTGNRSLHSVGQAIDVAGSPSAMAAFARSVAGRPGIAEIIYTPVGAWYPGAGWVKPSGSVAADHYDHVHVGVRGGDGLIGATVGRRPRTGDGLLGHGAAGYRRPPKPKPRKKSPVGKWRKMISRYARSKTGEADVDRLIASYNAKDTDRQNLERNYSVTEAERNANDRPLIVTKTAVDPVTGQTYEYEEVDFGAVQQERDDQDVLIALQGRIREKAVEMERLAKTIRSKIADVVAKLKKAISESLRGGSREEALRNRYTNEAKRIRGRISNLKGRLAAEKGKKKPSKALVRDLEDEIGMNEKSLRQAESEAKLAEGRRSKFEASRKGYEGRKETLDGQAPEWDQRTKDLGFDQREIDVRIGALQKQRGEILGTTAASFDLEAFRRENALPTSETGTDTPGDPGDTGSTPTPATVTKEEIAAQLATQTQAVIAARGRFVSEFGSDVFAPTGGGGGRFGFGSAAPSNVTVVQQFTRQPEDPYVWLKKSQYAAETVFGS